MEFYVEHIKKSFNDAENELSKINKELLNIDGMTGALTRHFYNNLLNFNDARYLEIGTWKGSSVCSAMYKNKATVVCIDNWCEFGGPKEEFILNFEKFKGENNAMFIENDSFSVNIELLPKFNIYMYDGNHTEESHYKALQYYINCLDDIFIYIVDDWNWENVRNGTFNAIKDLNLEKVYEKEVRLTNDNTHTPEQLAKNTWWNGIYIVILRKK